MQYVEIAVRIQDSGLLILNGEFLTIKLLTKHTPTSISGQVFSMSIS